MREKQNQGIQDEKHVHDSQARSVFRVGWIHGRGSLGGALARSQDP
jgi:hypothetical protein